jgi:tetratricopeptide (TPR) repeat protein
MVTYIRLLVWPSGLNLDYDFQPSMSIREPAVLPALVFLAGLIFLGWKWRRTRPVFSFSILWFFLTLSPTSSIIPITDVIYEHRLYLPLAGVCLAFPLAMEWVIRVTTRNTKVQIVAALAGVVLIVFTTATVLRNEVWRDDARLFADVVSKSPHKLRPYNDLMFAYMNRGQEQRAIEVAQLALQNLPGARVNLLDTIGNLYLRTRQPAKAAEAFKTSSDEASQSGWPLSWLAISYNNRGVAYLALSKTFNTGTSEQTEALRHAREAFQQSLEANPDDAGVLDSLINVRRSLGEAKVMEAELRARLAANSREFGSLYALAALLSLEERYEDSLGYFEQAAASDPSFDVVYFNYGFALSKAGRIDAAITQYLKALRIDPMFKEAHHNVALLYIQNRDYGSAVLHLTDILSQEPGNAKANLKLAEIHAYTGKRELARQYLGQALKADPQNPEGISLARQIGIQQ